MSADVLFTGAGVARRCIRCGHYECPCCLDFCDSCGDTDYYDEIVFENDGFVFKRSREDGETWEFHRVCSEEGRCVYFREQDPQMAKIGELAHERWGGQGGSFGVTEMGHVWWSGPEKEKENEEKT